jgi:hypothetical protein
MRIHPTRLAATSILALVFACAPQEAAPSAPVVAPLAPAAGEPPHELHLPPVGPAVHVTFDGKASDVVLANVPHDGNAAPLGAVWKLAFPAADPAPLHFDLVGSDGFHPASRAKCTRPLTAAEIAGGRIDVVTHNVTYDDALNLPGCYRVKAVVSLDATTVASP